MDLLQKIENQTVTEGQLEIYFIGQSGYVLKTNNSTIYIDPYLSDFIENPNGLNDTLMNRIYPPPFSPDQIQKCDAVICTHAHVDHMDPWTLNDIQTNFHFYSSKGAYEKSEFNIDNSRRTYLQPKKKYEISSFTVVPFRAAHYALTDEKGQPDCLSLLIKWETKTLFFWGDGIGYNGQIDLLSPFNFDYFFAPINGRDSIREKRGIIGNLKENELARLCSDLSICNVGPNHYDMFNENTGSKNLFIDEVNRVNKDQSILIMNCGDKIEL